VRDNSDIQSLRRAVRSKRTWDALSRAAVSVGIVIVAWAALTLIAHLAGYSPNGATILSYAIAGVVVSGLIWSLISMWHPFLRRTAHPKDSP
jgi:hypothetical protein